MLKNLKKRRAQLIGRGELAEAKAYNFFPVSFEMPKVCNYPTHGNKYFKVHEANAECLGRPYVPLPLGWAFCYLQAASGQTRKSNTAN